jgi:C-terminal processing protease CtpA/Prc
VGITPDVKVSATEADIDAKRDVQLYAAINELRDDLTQAAGP